MSRASSASRRHRARRRPTETKVPDNRALTTWAVAAGGLLAALLWSFWPVAVRLFKDWQNDPDYSIGQLVPLAALYLLWQERDALRKCRVTPCWWGLGVVLLALAGRLFGLRYLYESAERYALVLSVAGLVMLVAGWRVFWRLKPALQQ